jgi:hypothetical protein
MRLCLTVETDYTAPCAGNVLGSAVCFARSHDHTNTAMHSEKFLLRRILHLPHLPHKF